jgi:hypothetical protein
MVRSALLSTLLLVLTLQAAEAFAAEGDGSRPMNVAVTSTGDVVLATSMGSNKVTQARLSGGNWSLTYVDVGAPSWGVVLVSVTIAVVTHPGETHLSVLTRPNIYSNFSKDHEIELGDEFRYATEIIAKATHNELALFVATRGLPVSGQASWTHAVFWYDMMNDEVIRIVTEREPRALALSPNGNRLFVGTVQGALGGSPLATNNSLADNTSGGYLGDGGSILVYDMTSPAEPMMPLNGQRIGVGSPVRGIACSGNSNGTYSVYFTSVGDNANAEDPEESPEFFGGRQIPT